ncbi:Toll-like receptor 9 [Larimichthys crocea]|uniref:Toll-like receptor 9 n=1 Tax=Larimichthys crocea TaxID=215358 RepID=A0A6G0IPT5_LARCR|nr:Toll-like receptor 9 [Larimichthys crocea]
MPSTMAMLKNIFILCQFLPLVRNMNTIFFPCDTDVLWAGHKGYSQLAGGNSHQHYDAFVVFDTSNHAVRDWVYNELTVNLENGGHRSGATGSETVNGVIRQAFFMVQQRLLDEKVDAAVLILLDEMFPKLKYLQLRKRLCRKSVLSWPKNPRAQPLFWNRVRMALSLDNLNFYDTNMSESFI